MKPEEIKKIVDTALAEEFELESEQLFPEALIKEDLKLDSLDIVDLVLVIEQAFGFKLPDRNAIKNIRTLQDIYDFIETVQKDIEKEAAKQE